MNHDASRLDRLLNSDKNNITDETREAFLKETTHIAGEYFELKKPLVVQIKHLKTQYEVTLSFTASRVKNFTTLK